MNYHLGLHIERLQGWIQQHRPTRLWVTTQKHARQNQILAVVTRLQLIIKQKLITRIIALPQIRIKGLQQEEQKIFVFYGVERILCILLLIILIIDLILAMLGQISRIRSCWAACLGILCCPYNGAGLQNMILQSTIQHQGLHSLRWGATTQHNTARLDKVLCYLFLFL